MRWLTRCGAILVPFLVLLATACGSAATPAPASTPATTIEARGSSTSKEITLRVGLEFLFTQPPDPAKGGGMGLIKMGLGETLFKQGKDLKTEPWLATEARQLDEKTWDITLRQGVKFHNGAIMDATAVKASLERAIAKSPTAKARLDIAQIGLKNPFTLTITTNNPSPILPGLLTDPSSVIVEATAAEALGDAFAERPVLTGPFKVERYQQDKELVAVRHVEHWGPQPSVDRAIFKYIPDNNSRVLALQSGDIDIASYIAPESVPTVKNAPNLAVVSAAPVALEFIMLNHQREPWKDLRVRLAISLAIDRAALVKAVMQGQGAPATGPFPPRMLPCNQIREHPFNPAKARQLLGEAGYQDKDGDGFVDKDGQTLTMTLLTYRQRPELVPMAEAVQGSLKSIGIKVTVRLVEQITAALQQGDWDGGMYFNNMITTGDPHWALSRFFVTGGEANHGGYSNSGVDETSRRVGQATDRQTREQLACTASQAIVDDVAVVPLLYPNFNYGISKRVTGFDEPHPFWQYLMHDKIGKQ